MSDSFLDSIPSHERQKLRKMMSPEAYEKMREKVKGPQDLANEMRKAENLAEIHFSLESDPRMQESLKSSVDADIAEQGIEEVLDVSDVSADGIKSLEKKNFKLIVASHPKTHEDQLVAVPEGNVQEKVPVKLTFNDKYIAQVQSKRLAG